MTLPQAIHPDLYPGIEYKKLDIIVSKICEHMTWDYDRVTSKNRRHGNVFARNIIATLLRDHFSNDVIVYDANGLPVIKRIYDFSLNDIGKMLGNRHHSTILHSFDSNNNMLTDDRYTQYQENYKKVQEFLKVKYPKP